jgi:plastocyanin
MKMKTGFGTAVRIGASSLGLLLLSCSRGNPAPQAPPPQSHSIIIEGFRFAPADLTIRPGDTIVWTNKDVFVHTATAAGEFDSGAIDANGSWRFTPGKTGEVAYICTFHPTMKAIVRIKAGEVATRSNVQ